MVCPFIPREDSTMQITGLLRGRKLLSLTALIAILVLIWLVSRKLIPGSPLGEITGQNDKDRDADAALQHAVKIQPVEVSGVTINAVFIRGFSEVLNCEPLTPADALFLDAKRTENGLAAMVASNRARHAVEIIGNGQVAYTDKPQDFTGLRLRGHDVDPPVTIDDSVAPDGTTTLMVPSATGNKAVVIGKFWPGAYMSTKGYRYAAMRKESTNHGLLAIMIIDVMNGLIAGEVALPADLSPTHTEFALDSKTDCLIVAESSLKWLFCIDLSAARIKADAVGSGR